MFNQVLFLEWSWKLFFRSAEPRVAHKRRKTGNNFLSVFSKKLLLLYTTTTYEFIQEFYFFIVKKTSISGDVFLFDGLYFNSILQYIISQTSECSRVPATCPDLYKYIYKWAWTWAYKLYMSNNQHEIWSHFI